LVIESIVTYGAVFRYFEVYTFLYPVIFVIFIKWLAKELCVDLLAFTVKFYLVAYVVFMILFGQEFSLTVRLIEMVDYGPFSGDARIIHAQSLLLIIVPFLWYLNKYINTQKRWYLFWFYVCFLIILLHQHRSVWSTAIVATAVYFFMAVRSNRKVIPAILKFLGISLLLAWIFLTAVSEFYPAMIGYFGNRFSEILHPSMTEGTTSFRINQSLAYVDFIRQRPVLGWSFEGYEMKNPFIDRWPAKSGQHFHVGYVEMLFYHGLVGLLLKYAFLFYILKLSFSKKLSEQFMVLASFCIGGFVFSLCYVLPLMFWAQVGLCLYYFENPLLRRSRSNRLFGFPST
jgi:hypothetical protein